MEPQKPLAWYSEHDLPRVMLVCVEAINPGPLAISSLPSREEKNIQPRSYRARGGVKRPIQ